MAIINQFTEIIPGNHYSMSSPIKAHKVLFCEKIFLNLIFNNFKFNI